MLSICSKQNSNEQNTIRQHREKRDKILVLRQHVPEDAEFLYAHFGTDEKMSAYSGWNPYAAPDMARDTIRRFIDSYADEFFFGWAIDADKRMIGTIGAYDYDANLSCIEVGISIDRDNWGKGYATEALKAVLSYLTHDKQIRVVKAWCASDNIGSKKVMEKCGMKSAGVESGALRINGKVFDKLNYEYSAEK